MAALTWFYSAGSPRVFDDLTHDEFMGMVAFMARAMKKER